MHYWLRDRYLSELSLPRAGSRHRMRAPESGEGSPCRFLLGSQKKKYKLLFFWEVDSTLQNCCLKGLVLMKCALLSVLCLGSGNKDKGKWTLIFKQVIDVMKEANKRSTDSR